MQREKENLGLHLFHVFISLFQSHAHTHTHKREIEIIKEIKLIPYACFIFKNWACFEDLEKKHRKCDSQESTNTFSTSPLTFLANLLLDKTKKRFLYDSSVLSKENIPPFLLTSVQVLIYLFWIREGTGQWRAYHVGSRLLKMFRTIVLF